MANCKLPELVYNPVWCACVRLIADFTYNILMTGPSWLQAALKKKLVFHKSGR